MSAAARLARLDPHAEITVLERSAHVSYANCGLPYFAGGIIPTVEDLLLQTPPALARRFGLDVRVRHEVRRIDRSARRVDGVDLESGRAFSLDYDYLVLSPGASPVVPPVPGVERALTLRTVEDAVALRVAADHHHRALVVGAGFVGLEVAESLVTRGLSVTLVEAAEQVLTPLDPELAVLVADELVRHGIDLHLGAGLVRLDTTTATLADGSAVPADLAVLAIGVRPDVRLAAEAGLVIGPSGAIAVDEFQRTSDERIYAVGDAAEKTDPTGATVPIALANLANRHGRRVADHIAGLPVSPVASLGTAIVRVFDLTVALTGFSERRLVALGRPHLALHTHPASHAGYYPGAHAMSLKLLVDPRDGAILGAQGVGREGVDKRIDVIATAARAGLSAPDLADLELAYAPPFSSAKDPVNQLGYVAENVLTGLDEVVQWHEVGGLRDAGVALLDVRTPEEFARGSVPGARNLPVDELAERLDEVPRDVVVICAVGQRGHVATRRLRESGVRARNLSGGYRTWSASPAAASPPPLCPQ